MFRVEKVLTNSNYIIRKIGTDFTQRVHRIRLRSIKPNEKPDDLEQIDQQKFETDPSLTKYRSEPEMFDDHLQTLIDDIQLTYHQEKIEPAPAKISLAIPIGPSPPMPIAPAPPAAIPPAPVIMPPVAAPAIAPPLLPHGIQEPAELEVQPAEEVIEEDNDDESNGSELSDHDQFNNQMIRQNEQQADSLEDFNLDNLFREQTPDDQPVPQQASPASVSFNKTVKVRPISPRESLPSARTGMRTNSGQEIAPQVFMDKSTPRTTKKFNYKNELHKLIDKKDCRKKQKETW